MNYKRHDNAKYVTNGYHQPNVAVCYKDKAIIKHFSYVESIKIDRKYGYFIVTQKFFTKEILSIVRFNECNKIVYTDEKGIRKEVTIND